MNAGPLRPRSCPIEQRCRQLEVNKALTRSRRRLQRIAVAARRLPPRLAVAVVHARAGWRGPRSSVCHYVTPRCATLEAADPSSESGTARPGTAPASRQPARYPQTCSTQTDTEVSAIKLTPFE